MLHWLLFGGGGSGVTPALPELSLSSVSDSNAYLNFQSVFTITASIADNTALAFVLAEAPVGAELTASGNIAEVRWTPTTAVAPQTFRVSVGDAYGRTRSVSWVVTVRVPQVDQSLSLNLLSITPTVNLSPALDWRHWGLVNASSVNAKSGGAGLGSMSVLSGSSSRYDGATARQLLEWSDGDPTASASTRTGVFLSLTSGGYRITASGAAAPRRLVLFFGGFQSEGVLTASLSGGALTRMQTIPLTGTTGVDVVAEILYTAGADETLTIDWVKTGSTGNISIRAAALYSAAGLSVSGDLEFEVFVPETFTFTLTGGTGTETLEAENLPGAANFVDNGNQTATLSWVPGGGREVDSPYLITVRALQDGTVIASQQYAITVIAATAARPVLTYSGAFEFLLGGSDTVVITATGASTCTFTAEGLPGAATLVDNGDSTATLAWSPTNSGETFPITITATDAAGRSTTAALEMLSVASSASALLEINVVTSPASANLTSDGDLDWVHWGLETSASLNRKVVP